MPVGVEIMAPPGMEDMHQPAAGTFQNLGGIQTRRIKVRDAFRLLTDEEAARLACTRHQLKTRALEAVEQHGIVFLDEIDKVARSNGTQGADVSREECSVTCCHSLKAPRSTRSTAWSRRTISVYCIGCVSRVQLSHAIPEMQGRWPIWFY